MPRMQVGKRAAAVLNALTVGLTTPGDHAKIDNAPGAFMPVHVECLQRVKSEHGIARVFSVSHYYEQNGDLCADPDMTFLHTFVGCWMPLTFQQDSIALYQVAVELGPDLLPERYRPKLLADLCSFVNTWMGNIKEQQGIDTRQSKQASLAL